MTQTNSSLPLEDRVSIAYQEARKRANIPWRVLDSKYNMLRAALGRFRAMAASLDNSVKNQAEPLRKAALEDAEAFFIRARDMDPCQFHTLSPTVSSPLPSDKDLAVSCVKNLIANGFSFEVVRPSKLVVTPASRLCQQDRDTIVRLKKEIMTEVERQKDAWTI